MQNQLLLQSLEVMEIIERLIKHHESLPSSLDLYRASLKSSIGSLLELLSGMFGEIARNSPHSPGAEIGIEPLSFDEAWESLPHFLKLCREHIADFAQATASLPAIEMEVRCTTYFAWFAAEQAAEG